MRNGLEERHHTRHIPMPARRVHYSAHRERVMLEAYCNHLAGKVRGRFLLRP